MSSNAKGMSGRACKAKGNRAEIEFVSIMTAEGIPSQRVIGSGAIKGAKSDVKVGVTLTKEGKLPAPDESQALLRAEVKNRKDNPEFLHVDANGLQLAITQASREGSELLWRHLNQDDVSTIVVLKRAKTPQGALKNKDYNQAYGVFMGLADFIKLLKKVHNID